MYYNAKEIYMTNSKVFMFMEPKTSQSDPMNQIITDHNREWCRI